MREQSGEVTGQQQRLDVQIGVSFDFFSIRRNCHIQHILSSVLPKRHVLRAGPACAAFRCVAVEEQLGGE
jgi:hypothetical protein